MDFRVYMVFLYWIILEMAIQKSRKVRRGQKKHGKSRKQRFSKRRQGKRRQTKKKQNRNHKRSKKYYGGKFNEQDESILMERMRESNYTEKEITDIMSKLHEGAHYFSGDDLPQLLSYFNRMDKEQFKVWVDEHYGRLASDDETDWEDLED